MSSIPGRCLCGAVTFTLTLPFERFMVCHCSRCRRTNGSAFATNLFARSHQLRWLTGEAEVQRFDLPEAPRFSNCFCRHCGSPVPRLSRDGSHVVVPAGTLDGDPQIRPQARIYWGDRACWHDAIAEQEHYDGYPE